MKDRLIYKINNLVCAYNEKQKVLEINELDIPLGKMIIILGMSGVGKSTLLETLGLMNKTLKRGSEVTLFLNDKAMNLYDLWSEGNDLKISSIRKKHFSFIFQETNLMPNFTAFENISITQMINGVAKEDAIKKAKEMAKSLELHINEEKKSFELSGGERQRAAFIRAITTEFEVLFGDEPTGNLDEENSYKLIQILKDNIKENSRTAIIVSHNIDLAIDFADILLVLRKRMTSPDTGFGDLPASNIFYSSHSSNKRVWVNNKNEDVTETIRKSLKALMIDHSLIDNINFTQNDSL